ncbi:hypothetical protein NA78x_003840 [Anatilimnocola sp. NA78]|uniref:hypothetical protein n=1 Tax=Anatilimnocola sp. NA78 TaxID=3415683 RepID=UPI003CE588DD
MTSTLSQLKGFLVGNIDISDVRRRYEDMTDLWPRHAILHLDSKCEGTASQWVVECLLAAMRSSRCPESEITRLLKFMSSADRDAIMKLAADYETHQANKLMVAVACMLVSRVAVIDGSLPRGRSYLLAAMSHLRDYCLANEISPDFIFSLLTAADLANE